MVDELQPDWLERDKHIISGLDHLGIEVVSSKLYGMLLPGISNLTERARYFSVYPWVLHEFAQQTTTRRTKQEWRTWIRRLEFTYALASVAYERSQGRRAKHAAGVVGAVAARKATRKLEPDTRVAIGEKAALNDKGRGKKGSYFKHGEGGYGQYYKGPLTSLGALIKNKQEHPNRQLTSYCGVKLAEATAQTSGFSTLLDVASAGAASLSELEAVGAAVYPGGLQPQGDEVALLRGLLLGSDDTLCRGQLPTSRLRRRRSMHLMLHLTLSAEEVEGSFVSAFRRACFERQLPSGEGWVVPERLEETRLAWGAYQRNELFNYALECFFWAAMNLLDEEPREPRALARELAAAGCEPLQDEEPGNRDPVEGTVAVAMERVRDGGTPWAWASLLETTEDVWQTCRVASRVLLWLGTPDAASPDHAFAVLPEAVKYASVRDVHLAEWLGRVGAQHDSDVESFLEQIILEWVLFRHLRVATRKLAVQGDSTFKFRPEIGRLVVSDDCPDPTFTNPRVREARQMLIDLHLLGEADKKTVLLADGEAELGDAL